MRERGVCGRTDSRFGEGWTGGKRKEEEKMMREERRSVCARVWNWLLMFDPDGNVEFSYYNI